MQKAKQTTKFAASFTRAEQAPERAPFIRRAWRLPARVSAYAFIRPSGSRRCRQNGPQPAEKKKKVSNMLESAFPSKHTVFVAALLGSSSEDVWDGTIKKMCHAK